MKTLDELYQKRDQLEELVKYARLLGGKVKIGDEMITRTELQEMLNTIKIEIATKISGSKLKLINPLNGKS
jgi:Holliday junction resolvase